ncbi:MAG: DUF5615 family PIN-like protein [Phycisphaerae bacterium]
MKLLLDENLPHQLRLELPGHDVFTTAYLKWTGITNGELLRRAAAEGFDALITNDRGLAYQQNQDALPLSVVVLLAPANTVEALRPMMPRVLVVLSELQPRVLVRISTG